MPKKEVPIRGLGELKQGDVVVSEFGSFVNLTVEREVPWEDGTVLQRPGRIDEPGAYAVRAFDRWFIIQPTGGPYEAAREWEPPAAYQPIETKEI